ncbi:MAG: hypothetical protein Q9218_000075 [Villophora microphyllina]
MSANNNALKGVLGNKYKTVGVVEEPKPAEDPSQRRRSSSIAKYNGLMNQKRNSSDIAAAARKASFAEQNKAPGIFGGFWQRSDAIETLWRVVNANSVLQLHQGHWFFRKQVVWDKVEDIQEAV